MNDKRGDTREARAQRLVLAITAASCDGLGVWWTEREVAHRTAATRTARVAAAAPALALCQGCPELDRCEALARVDRYTGLAAGVAWRLGVPRPAGHWSPHRLPRVDDLDELRRTG